MKQLPIGLSDYKQLIEEDWYYIDKTLLIEDLINYGGLVSLITRPRRFGKTLNLSMLKYFFEKANDSNEHLFVDKKIWSVSKARALQGKFPVIFMTFKGVKETTWESTYEKFIHLIAKEYRRHEYLLDSPALSPNEKAIFTRIVLLLSSEAEYHMSLVYLSNFLERHHGEKAIILIDEYDAPVHGALFHGYYEKVACFVRSFLGDGLKDNSSLKLGVISGILRTAKEGIFSGLNNPKVFTILQERFADKFGFTDGEIDQLLNDYKLDKIKEDFKSWYNGYLIGETCIYNPWSSLGCVDEQGKLQPYWVNTSDNALVAKLIATASPQIKEACVELFKGNVLPEIRIEENMVLPGMVGNPNSIWSLLLFSGYLTAASYKLSEGMQYGNLVIPNKEIQILFEDLVDKLFRQSLGQSEVAVLEEALRKADGGLFSTMLSKFMTQSMSWHDISENEPESSYHLFVLGLLVVFSNSYSIRSNRESGYGRYDIVLVPHDLSRPGIVIEFKKKEANETLEECAERALEQIVQKKYAAELQSAGIKNIALFAIAFHKKEVLLKQA